MWPFKKRNYLKEFQHLLNRCESNRQINQKINLSHWRTLAESGNLFEAAQGFQSEAQLKEILLPSGYWIIVHRIIRKFKP